MSKIVDLPAEYRLQLVGEVAQFISDLWYYERIGATASGAVHSILPALAAGHQIYLSPHLKITRRLKRATVLWEKLQPFLSTDPRDGESLGRDGSIQSSRERLLKLKFFIPGDTTV